MNIRFFKLIVLVGVSILFSSNSLFCYSAEQSRVKNCEDIFVILHPEQLTFDKISNEIKKIIPNAKISIVEGTYIIKLSGEHCDTEKYDKAITKVFFELPETLLREDVLPEELTEIQKGNVFYSVVLRTTIGDIGEDPKLDGVYQAIIKVEIESSDDKIINSMKHLLFNKSNIYKFLSKNSSFLNMPFFDKEETYNNYLEKVMNSFGFIHKEDGVFEIKIVSQDRRFVEKGLDFFVKEYERLFEDFKSGYGLLHRNVWDNEYNTIFWETPPWKKEHKIKVRETKGELEEKLKNTRITCTFENIYLNDFIDFLRKKQLFSYHIKYKANFTGRKIKIKEENALGIIVLPYYGEKLEFMGSHVFSVRAENVELGTLLTKILKKIGYKYEVGTSGGLEVLFIEPE